MTFLLVAFLMLALLTAGALLADRLPGTDLERFLEHLFPVPDDQEQR